MSIPFLFLQSTIPSAGLVSCRSSNEAVERPFSVEITAAKAAMVFDRDFHDDLVKTLGFLRVAVVTVESTLTLIAGAIVGVRILGPLFRGRARISARRFVVDILLIVVRIALVTDVVVVVVFSAAETPGITLGTFGILVLVWAVAALPPLVALAVGFVVLPPARDLRGVVSLALLMDLAPARDLRGVFFLALLEVV